MSADDPGAPEPRRARRPRVLREDGGAESPLVNTRSDALRAVGDGRYQMLGEIARGGMGVVLKGRDTRLGRDVAMKVLHARFRHQTDIVQRFVEEAQIGGQLQHPGIVPVYSMGLQDGKVPFFTMKLVRGRTLSSLLDERRDQPDARQELLTIFESVCRTVSYAHSRGVIHRDLKPSNVMIGKFGEVQVVDWGLAKVLGRAEPERERRVEEQLLTVIATVRSESGGSASMTGSVLGTPEYMPPEQARGEVETLDARADVFALGAILCEMVTGVPPYTGKLSELVKAASNADLGACRERIAASNVDDDLAALLHSYLAPAKAARPADAGVVANEVSAYLASLEGRTRAAVVAAAEDRAREEEDRRARRLVRVLGAVVFAAILLGAGGYAWISHQRGRREAVAARAVSGALQDATLSSGSAAGGERQAWEDAVTEATRVVDLAESSGAGEAAIERARTMLAALERERDAALGAEEKRQRERRFLARLRSFASEVLLDDGRRHEDRVAAAFEEMGLDPLALDVSDLEQDDAHATIAAALDAWAAERRALGRDDTELIAAAKQVDTDALRRRIYGVESVPALRSIAGEIDVASTPVATLCLLGRALLRAGDGERGAELLDKAWMTNASDTTLNLLLGRAIERRGGDLARQGARYFMAAKVLDLESAVAPTLLGRALHRDGEYGLAMEAFEAALGSEPEHAGAHTGLAMMLLDTGDAVGAEREFQAALRADPESPLALCGAGLALARQGRFPAAHAFLVSGHEKGLERRDWGYDSGAWLSECERRMEVESHLQEATRTLDPAVEPERAEELARTHADLGFAARSARLWSDLLATGHVPAGTSPHFDAARAAARAGTGLGRDAESIDAAERAAWRAQVVPWLRGELASIRAGLDARPFLGSRRARTVLGRWLASVDLAGVRDASELARLRTQERAELEEFWAAVRDVWGRACR